MDAGIPLTEAAKRMGMSREALRKRVARGSIKAYKDGDGIWRVVIPETEDAQQRADAGADGGMGRGTDATLDAGADASVGDISGAELREELAFLRGRVLLLPVLENEVSFLRGELDTRKREVEELHVLLQTAQRQLSPGPATAASASETRKTGQMPHPAPSAASGGVQPHSRGFWQRLRTAFGASA